MFHLAAGVVNNVYQDKISITCDMEAAAQRLIRASLELVSRKVNSLNFGLKSLYEFLGDRATQIDTHSGSYWLAAVKRCRFAGVLSPSEFFPADDWMRRTKFLTDI